ncbi:MAG: transporter [Bacteroidota bacterium]|jgi:hypothetical protein
MKRKNISSCCHVSISLALILASLKSIAQQLPSIQTDRPDQTECPYIVPAKHVQVELGFNYESINKTEKNWILPTALWKYGINENFELRLITEINKNEITGKANSQPGLLPTEIGFKVKLIEENGIIPKISFISHLAIPKLSSKDFRTTYYAPNFRFTMLHSLSDDIVLSYNLGAEWNGESPEPIFIYTLSPAYSFNDKLSAYIELYGFAPQQQRADHRADGGIVYLLKDNIQLDISGGCRVSENAPEYYGALGLSVRWPR